MINDIIKISCPTCGAVLMVREVPGIENKFVTCPNCKKQSHFSNFKKIVEEEEHTQYGGPESELNKGKDQASAPRFKIGSLFSPSTGRNFQLRPGKNIIGRKSPNSAADIQLECSNYISRNHLVVEVLGNPIQGYNYCVSLFKKNVNKTFIGCNELIFGDSLILNNGDIIKLPDLDLVFKD